MPFTNNRWEAKKLKAVCLYTAFFLFQTGSCAGNLRSCFKGGGEEDVFN